MLQPGSGYPLERVCMRSPLLFDYSLAFARPLGEFEFELKIDGATEKIINHQRHLSKARPVDPDHS
jgi:hypothetical protein